MRNRRPMAVGATLKMSASSTALPGRWPRVNYFARNIPLPRAKSKSQHNELYLLSSPLRLFTPVRERGETKIGFNYRCC